MQIRRQRRSALGPDPGPDPEGGGPDRVRDTGDLLKLVIRRAEMGKLCFVCLFSREQQS